MLVAIAWKFRLRLTPEMTNMDLPVKLCERMRGLDHATTDQVHLLDHRHSNSDRGILLSSRFGSNRAKLCGACLWADCRYRHVDLPRGVPQKGPERSSEAIVAAVCNPSTPSRSRQLSSMPMVTPSKSGTFISRS